MNEVSIKPIHLFTRNLDSNTLRPQGSFHTVKEAQDYAADLPAANGIEFLVFSLYQRGVVKQIDWALATDTASNRRAVNIEKPARSSTRWSDTEVEVLRQGMKDNLSAKEISECLHRTEKAVYLRMYKEQGHAAKKSNSEPSPTH